MPARLEADLRKGHGEAAHRSTRAVPARSRAAGTIERRRTVSVVANWAGARPPRRSVDLQLEWKLAGRPEPEWTRRQVADCFHPARRRLNPRFWSGGGAALPPTRATWRLAPITLQSSAGWSGGLRRSVVQDEKPAAVLPVHRPVRTRALRQALTRRFSQAAARWSLCDRRYGCGSGKTQPPSRRALGHPGEAGRPGLVCPLNAYSPRPRPAARRSDPPQRWSASCACWESPAQHPPPATCPPASRLPRPPPSAPTLWCCTTPADSDQVRPLLPGPWLVLYWSPAVVVSQRTSMPAAVHLAVDKSSPQTKALASSPAVGEFPPAQDSRRPPRIARLCRPAAAGPRLSLEHILSTPGLDADRSTSDPPRQPRANGASTPS